MRLYDCGEYVESPQSYTGPLLLVQVAVQQRVQFTQPVVLRGVDGPRQVCDQTHHRALLHQTRTHRWSMQVNSVSLHTRLCFITINGDLVAQASLLLVDVEAPRLQYLASLVYLY